MRTGRTDGRLRAAACLALAIGMAGLPARAAEPAPTKQRPRQHPWIFVTAEKIDGLRSLEEVRLGIRQGHAAELWRQLLAKVEEEMKQPPIAPRQQNRNYEIVATTANRITDASLVALITGERRYADAALAQIDALFDLEQWPEWSDKAHIQVGLKVDLRHGQLARALGMAYDWLHVLLTEEERRRFLAGLDRRAIRPYKEAVEAKEKWLNRQSNWMTCIVGGFGILGMALGPDHPDSAWMVELSGPRMRRYMSAFGPEGEFNESVQYSGSTMYVVGYFQAERYAGGGQQNPLRQLGLADFCRWYMYGTLPPGRVVGFGDPGADMPPVVGHLSAVAASLRDPMIQWFYLKYADLMLATHRRLALDLLFFDPTVEALSPEGRLPLGRAYHNQAKIITSRDSWDPDSTTSVVYAKAAQEDYHGHADWGQVCIDGYGERLIVDLGSPPGYPRSHKQRYYNYQQFGHNVLVFGANETGGIPVGKARRGKITHHEFDNLRGGAWTMDLSEPYGEDRRVVRHVVHLLPRIVVVLDEARLPATEPISLRWHAITPPELDDEGRFAVRGERAVTVGHVQRLDGESELRLDRHEYRAPYDKDRLGNPYPQRHEPFVELKTEDDTCRILSTFCVFGPGDQPSVWQASAGGWSIETPEGSVRVSVKNDCLAVENTTTQRGWQLVLQP